MSVLEIERSKYQPMVNEISVNDVENEHGNDAESLFGGMDELINDTNPAVLEPEAPLKAEKTASQADFISISFEPGNRSIMRKTETR